MKDVWICSTICVNTTQAEDYKHGTSWVFFITPGCEFSYVLMFSIYSEHLFLKNKIIYFVGIPETRLWIGTKHQQVLSNHMDQESMQDLGAIL